MSQLPPKEELPEEEAPETPSPASAPLYRFVTVLFTWVVVLFGISAVQMLFVAPEFQTVENQVAAAVRIVERDLEVATAEAVQGGADDSAYWNSVARAAEILAELAEVVPEEDRVDLLARRAVLEGEQGTPRAAQWILAALDDSREAREFERTFRRAYEGAALSGDELTGSGQSQLLLPRSGWTRDTLTRRVTDDQRVKLELEEATLQRGEETRGLQRRIELTNLALLPLGLLAAFLWWKRSSRRTQIGRGIGVPPWTGAEGLGVIVRAIVFGVGLSGVAMNFDTERDQTTILSWMNLWLGVPMLVLAWRSLLKPNGLDFLSTFGFRLAKNFDGSRRIFELVTVTFMLLALQQLGFTLLSALGSLTGFEPRWSDGLVPAVILGSEWTFGMHAIDVVVFGPLCLEIAFRGLLYTTLRTKLQPHRAALAGAVLFGLIHAVSLPSFLALVWSGYLLGLAYEKTRSLLPGIFCHMIANLSALLVFATYR